LAGSNASYGTCNQGGIVNLPPVGATFNVLVHGDSTRSSVVVTADWIGYDSNGSSRLPCVTTGKWEQEFETAIKAQAEARYIRPSLLGCYRDAVTNIGEQ